MFKIILSYTVSGQARMKRYLANEKSLSPTLNAVCNQIGTYLLNNITINKCEITPCTDAEMTQIGNEMLQEVINLLKQSPNVVAVTRDNCPLFMKDVSSKLAIYVSKYSQDLLSLKQNLSYYYNTLPAGYGYTTEIQIKHDEDPDLSLPHLVPGTDY